MHTHDHSSAWSQDPREDKTLQLFEDVIGQENEQQEVIHRLTHQGMDEALAGHIECAEDIFSRALTLAREQHYPRWEAQVLYYAGAVFDRRGMPERALTYAEQALVLFHEYGPLRMEASVGTLLASLLYKTGRPQGAPSLIERVVDQLMNGVDTGQISLPEGQYQLFGAYHQMGHIYRALHRLPQAVDTFEEALELARDLQSDQDVHTIIVDLIDLFLETGELARAVELGEDARRQTGGFDPHNLEFLTSVNFDLGLAYSQREEWEASIDRSRAAYAYFRRNRASAPPSPLYPATWDTAFVGKLLVNLGSAYNGLACAAQREDFYAASLGYWRMGEELLAQAGAEDVETPRRNLRLVRQAYPGGAVYDLLIEMSEPLLQSLRAEMAGNLAAERDESIRRGRHALTRKQYDAAADHFLRAMERDPFDLCPGRHWHALTRLLTCHRFRDLVEIAACFEMDSQGAREVVAASLLFAEWCKMGQYPTARDYLEKTWPASALVSGEDPIERLEGLARRHAGRPEALIYAAVMQFLRGNGQECLQVLEAEGSDTPTLSWCRAFWRAAALASGGQEEQARTLIEQALRLGMPPVLLGPLRWLKASDAAPTSFFMLVVRPLFLRYGLPYGEERAYHTDEDSTLPSRVRKIKAVRAGLPSTPPTPDDAEYQGHHVLQLPDVRGPGGEAHLIYVEFDAAENELWPTTFAVRYPAAGGEVARRWQEYWIDYAPGRQQVTLVDRDFQKLALPLDPTGWDYDGGGWTRGGRYWADPGADLQVEETGTTVRFERLPRGTLAYLRRLLDEAVPHLEIFCEACSHQTRRVGDVWCEHIWWCEKCQHISSPLERSRKMMGQGAHYCPHRFPQEEA